MLRGWKCLSFTPEYRNILNMVGSGKRGGVRKLARARETYVPPACLASELRMLGWDHFRKASVMGLAPHEHKSAYEICYLRRGSVEWWAGREIYRLEPGDIFITRPDEPHGGVDTVMQPCELNWLIIEIPARGSLLGMSAAESKTLSLAFKRMTLHAFPGSRQVADHFDRLILEHRNRGPHASVSTRAIMQNLLIEVLALHDRCLREGRSVKSQAIMAAQDWIEKNLSEPLSVHGMARAAGLKVSRFCQRFRVEVGFTAGEYLERRRIHLAKKLLSGGSASITAIANRVGFATSQYFATVFKKLVAMTPGDFRRKVADSGRPDRGQ
jgi:AraC-like DNA-binding protein